MFDYSYLVWALIGKTDFNTVYIPLCDSISHTDTTPHTKPDVVAIRSTMWYINSLHIEVYLLAAAT